jgi:PAS domain S-box-containing protein
MKYRFESIVESAALAVCRIAADGRIEHVNPAAERLLGYTAGDLVGRELHAVVHPRHDEADDDGADCAMFGLGRGGRRRVTVTDRFTRRDGSQLDIEATSAPIIVGDGAVAGAVVVLQDVTARVLVDQMKDDFIGFASHELRSPLTTINGMAKWLLKDATRHRDRFTDDELEAIEALSTGSDRMGGIIELFLDLTRIESDRLVLDPQEVDLAKLLRTEAAALTERSTGAHVSVDAPEGPLIAWVDGHRVRQVLVNLLDNAAKYGGKPPEIHAEVEAGEHFVTFRVRDNGGGIAPHDAPRVFDRFYRGKDVSGKGLGIGLFVSREIAQRLGGTLTFESVEGGTVFSLTVPVERHAPPPEQPRRRRTTSPA